MKVHISHISFCFFISRLPYYIAIALEAGTQSNAHMVDLSVFILVHFNFLWIGIDLCIGNYGPLLYACATVC